MSRAVSLRRLFAKITEEGVFGACDLITCKFENESDTGVHFMSSILFVTIRVADKDGSVRSIPVVVKLQPDDELHRSNNSTSAMFENEVNMYKNIIPLIGADRARIFPVAYYCHAVGGTNYKEDVIVLKDLREEWFVLSKLRGENQVFLDLPHLLLSLRKLGEFHGLSYKYKDDNHEQPNLKNINLTPIKYSKEWLEKAKPILIHVAKKYCDDLVKEGYDKAQFDQLLKMFHDDLEGMLTFVTKPVEPFATICHGDFNRNNLLFKYDGLTNVPVEVIFFDLQNSIYSDPVVDLGFFLFMSTSEKTREAHWSELLDAYWSGIQARAPRPGFTRAQFFANLENKIFLGFFEPGFFLPVVFNAVKGDSAEEFITVSSEKQGSVLDRFGGAEAHEAVRNVLKNMVDKNYLRNFLDSFKKSKTWYLQSNRDL